MNFQWLENLTRNKSVLSMGKFFILAISIIFIGYGTKIISLQKTMRTLSTRQQKLEQRIKAKKLGLQTQRTFSLSKIPQKITANFNFLEEIALLDQCANQNRVTIDVLKQLSSANNQNQSNHQLQLSCRGNYENLITLLNTVLFTSQTLSLDKLAMEKQSDNLLAMHLSLTGHLHGIDILKNIALKKIDSNQGNPFDTQKYGVNLAHWNLDELRLLGTISDGNQCHGIIADPFNNIYQVKINDPIGIKQNIIKTITNSVITTSDSREQIRDKICK